LEEEEEEEEEEEKEEKKKKNHLQRTDTNHWYHCSRKVNPTDSMKKNLSCKSRYLLS
jgi:hypothetical protein